MVGQVKDYAGVTQSPYTLEAHSIARAGAAYGVHNPAQLASQPRGELTPYREFEVKRRESSGWRPRGTPRRCEFIRTFSATLAVITRHSMCE